MFTDEWVKPLNWWQYSLVVGGILLSCFLISAVHAIRKRREFSPSLSTANKPWAIAEGVQPPLYLAVLIAFFSAIQTFIQQTPESTESYYSAFLDTFGSWVIFLAILAVIVYGGWRLLLGKTPSPGYHQTWR